MAINKYEKFGSRGFAPSSTTVGDYEGDVVFIGGFFGETEVNVTVGQLYYLATNGGWRGSNANAASSSTSLLGIACGTGNPETVGMLLKGMITVSVEPGEGLGLPLYVSGTEGRITQTAPTGASDVVRVVGYKITEGTNKQIWFNPDNTWVVIAG
tara:strand:+ start:1703 stop:2167 length:465 start_codon:yes stop_codon:yes gene_type:complete